jgi:hypothetical protein
MNNNRERIDNTGDRVRYGIDFQMNFPITRYFHLGLGADSLVGSNQFTQASGRFETVIHLPWINSEIGLFHRSSHNFDYVSVPTQPLFYSNNNIFFRYNFGKNPHGTSPKPVW